MNEHNACIAALKQPTFEEARKLALPVKNAEGSTIGTLVPIGRWIETDEEKIRSMVTWRNAAKKMFPTQVNATYESTLAYLIRSSIDNERGLLFAIVDTDERFVGHIGVTDVQSEQFELAHLIKGVEGADPKLIFYSEISLIDWCFRIFGAGRAVVEIMSYNWIVSMLHKEIGFEIESTYQLKMTKDEAGVTHQIVPAEEANVKYTIVKLELHKNCFYEQLQRLNYPVY